MADHAALSASLTLKFEDLVSPSLKRLLEMFERLGATAQRFNLNGFTEGVNRINRVTGATKALADALKPLPGILKRVNFTQMAQSAERVPWISEQLDKMGSAAGRARAAVGRLWNGMKAGAGKVFGDLKGVGDRMGALGGVVAGASLVGPIEHWADFSNTLRHTAITEGMEGAAVEPEIARLRTLFYKDALETGQSSRSIAEAYSNLKQQGIPTAQMDTVIAAHSRAATAYNISPEALGPAVGALIQNLHVSEGDIGGALAAMAVASREGRFKVTDFSGLLPGVAAKMAGWGATGRDAANVTFASLQTVMKNSSIPSQAATDFTDALDYLGRPQGQKRWKKDMGFDLMPFLTKARESGQDPVAAVMGALQTKMATMNIEEQKSFLGHMFGNIQAGNAWLALIQHAKDYQELLEKLRGVGPDTLMKNFADAARDPIVQLRIFREMISQLVDSLGIGFEPVLHAVNGGLVWLVTNFQAFQKAHPQIAAAILGITGVAIALLVVLSGIGMVVAGLATIGWIPAAIIAGVAGIGVAVYEIYEHWDGVVAFFKTIWEGIKSGVSDVITAFATIGKDVVDGIKSVFAPLVAWFKELWDNCAAPFKAAMEPIETALSKIGLGKENVTKNGEAAPTGVPTDMPTPADLARQAAPATVTPIYIDRAGPDARLRPGPNVTPSGAPDGGVFLGIP